MAVLTSASARGVVILSHLTDRGKRQGEGRAVACLARNASDAIKERYLPRIVNGKTRFCFAITEADAGTNSFNMKTSAERKGDTFVINGSKTYISAEENSHYMLLVARTTPLEEAK